MDHPKIERLLRLIMMMSGSKDYTVEELARMMDTSSRTIYRYIDTFRYSGFVVEKRQPNVYKLAKFPGTQLNFNKLIYFSEEEAYIVHSLINSLNEPNSLKTNLQKKLAAVYQLTGAYDFVANKDLAKRIEALGTAIRNKQQVILKDYESAHSHTISNRILEPFAFTTNLIEIWGYDVEKQQNRVYKIARIGEVVSMDTPWMYESAHQKISTDCFRMNGTDCIPVTLELNLRAKNLLLEEFPLAARDLHPWSSEQKDPISLPQLSDENRWLLKTTVHNLAGVGRFVMGLLNDISLHDSPELKNYITEQLLQYHKKESETNGPALSVFTTE